MRKFGMLAIVTLVATPALAVDELYVADAKNRPIEGALICGIRGKEVERCGTTGKEGRYTIPGSLPDRVRIDADGYISREISMAAHQGPVVLELAPVLVVRPVNRATGEGIAAGEIWVAYPTGLRRGPFPFNAAGVSIRRALAPGDVLITVEAEGYRQEQPHRQRLVGGETADVKIELAPADE